MRNDRKQTRFSENVPLIYSGKGLRAVFQAYKRITRGRAVAAGDEYAMPQIQNNLDMATPIHEGLAAQMDRASADFEHATESQNRK